MMKKLIAILVSMLMVFGIASVSFAEEGNDLLISSWDDEEAHVISYMPTTIRVQNNGEFIDFTDSEGNVVEPQIINDRTMVPFRKIFNALGVTDENISWNGETRIVEAKKDNVVIGLQIDNPVAKKTVSGDTSEIKLDSAPVIVDGRTLVPVRFIAESMNKKVGWDNLNRTVIIIDSEELMADLEKAIPKYMEMANATVQMPETYDMNMKLTGELEYKDSKNKTNNSTVNLTGTLDMKKGEAIIALDADAKLTGKGQIYNLLENIGFTKLDFNMIANDNKVYLKSSLLEEQTNGKWIMTEDDSMKEAITLLDGNHTTVASLFEVAEENMNIYTYENMEMMAQMLKTLCKDENFKVTEKGSTKTYTFTVDIKDFISLYQDMGMEVTSEGMTGSVTSTATYKNNVAQTSVAEVKLTYKEGNESVTFELKIDGKVSSGNVTIQVPSDSQVMSADEV